MTQWGIYRIPRKYHKGKDPWLLSDDVLTNPVTIKTSIVLVLCEFNLLGVECCLLLVLIIYL